VGEEADTDELRQELLALRARNEHVELNKAWETSWTRRLIVTGVTWFAAWLWLLELGTLYAARQAVIPSVAYLLSTLSLPILKNRWIERRRGRKASGGQDKAA
jgi:hypothetical protein